MVGQYSDANGIVQRVPLSPDKSAASMMLNELLRKVEREKIGIVDPLVRYRKTPLTEHLSAWLTSLRANRRSEDYVVLKEARVSGVLSGCGWVFTADLSADRLETFLHELRQQGRSIQTSNDWLQAVRQFTRWMVVGGRIERDPITRVKGGNVRTDVRRRREELIPEEVCKVLVAASRDRLSREGTVCP